MQENTEQAFSGHYVICNWSDKADALIRELHSCVVREKPPIVVITDRPESMPKTTDPEYDAVFTVMGDPVDDAVLRRAGIETAATAIILADDREERFADTKSIIIALAIESIQPRVHTIVELLDSRNESHFEHTQVDEIICVDTLSEKLLAQAALSHGVSAVYMHLLTASADTNEIYFEPVPKAFLNKTYRELERALLNFEEEEIVLIGVVTKGTKERRGRKLMNHEGKELEEVYVTINPPSKKRPNLPRAKTNDYKLQESDQLIVLAYEDPVKLKDLKTINDQ